MKKLLFILFFSVLCNTHALSQPFKSFRDTANYLIYDVGAKKDLFIGKPFKELTQYLKLKIVDCSADPGFWGSVPMDFAQKVLFYFNIMPIDEFRKKHYMVVTFQSVPPRDIMYPLFYKEYHGMLTVDSVVNFYANFIVEKITIKRYYSSTDEDFDIELGEPNLLNPSIVQQQESIKATAQQYVGKPFSELYKNLQVRPKTIKGGACQEHTAECHTFFFYESMGALTSTNFVVEWEEPILMPEARQYSLRDYRVLDEKELAIYKNRIIKSIAAYDYVIAPAL